MTGNFTCSLLCTVPTVVHHSHQLVSAFSDTKEISTSPLVQPRFKCFDERYCYSSALTSFLLHFFISRSILSSINACYRIELFSWICSWRLDRGETWLRTLLLQMYEILDSWKCLMHVTVFLDFGWVQLCLNFFVVGIIMHLA